VAVLAFDEEKLDQTVCQGQILHWHNVRIGNASVIQPIDIRLYQAVFQGNKPYFLSQFSSILKVFLSKTKEQKIENWNH